MKYVINALFPTCIIKIINSKEITKAAIGERAVWKTCSSVLETKNYLFTFLVNKMKSMMETSDMMEMMVERSQGIR